MTASKSRTLSVPTEMSPIMFVVMSIMPKNESNQDITQMYSGHLHKPLNGTCACECAVDESGDGGSYSCGSDCYMCD